MLRGVKRGLAIAACVIGACTPAHETAPRAPAISGLVVTDRAIGPITTSTPATLQALRAALGASYVVTAKNVNNTLRYEVSHDGEKVLEIKPDDDGTIDVVRVISQHVPVTVRAWQVGQPFTHTEVLSGCDCDDDVEDHAVCYARGEHLAVGFAHGCEHLGDTTARKVLAGATIDRLVWSAKPWGVATDADDPPEGSP